MPKAKRKLAKNHAETAAQESAETVKAPSLPAFSKNLKAVCIDEEIGGIADWVRISPTTSMRVKRFFISFFEAFIIALIVLAIFYLPDFIADYSRRSEEFLKFFGNFLLAAGGIISVCAAISTLLRDIVIYVSPSKKCIYQGVRMTPKHAEEAIALSTIDSLAIEPPGFLKRSRLLANINDSMAVLGETLGDNQDLVVLLQWLKEIQ
ncbi:MAG: hypothetical protein J6A01_01475 [Proteobacteria bacterium]|nr:hypothetical protein [Pseudomonadota bacterium]